MPRYCTNTTWIDGNVSSVRKTEEKPWMIGADIKSDNWTQKGGYRSLYECPSSK